MTQETMSQEDREKELTLLRNSYEMYERDKDETRTVRESRTDKDGNRIYTDKSVDDTIKLLETMQQDIKDKYLALGGNPEDLKLSADRRKIDRSAARAVLAKISAREEMAQYIQQMNANDNVEKEQKEQAEAQFVPKEEPLHVLKPSMEPDWDPYRHDEPEVDTIPQPSISEPVEASEWASNPFAEKQQENTNRGNKISYDKVPLPSRGECYRNKVGKIDVAYLTAYDENLIVSPNLYKDGSFLDVLVKSKIMDDRINVEELLPGDRDAIILWLRATGYGPEFPATAVDPATGEEFDTTIDLTKIKYKKFNLKGDANGFFDYELPLCKDRVKFKFLSYKDVKKLDEISKNEDNIIKKAEVLRLADELKYRLETEEIDTGLRLKLNEAVKNIEEYGNGITEAQGSLYTHAITDRLAASIVSINNITDRRYINEYVVNMNVRESSALRKYIKDNEPGVDFNVEVERPASLGGGSTTIFLTLDQYLFLQIA